MTIDTIKIARQSVKIALMDDFSLQTGVQEIMREVALMNGKDEIAFARFAPLLAQKLRSEFGAMSLDEVQVAFRAGTEEEFGKNFAITYATLLQWLRGYVNDRRVAVVYEIERRAAARARKASMKTMGDIKKEERIRNGNVELIRRRWRDLSEGRKSFEVPRAGAMAYDFLKGLGLLKDDEIRRRRAENMLNVEIPHPFIASLDRGRADEVLLASLKNIELRLFLKDLFSRGEQLPFSETDMPSFI